MKRRPSARRALAAAVLAFAALAPAARAGDGDEPDPCFGSCPPEYAGKTVPELFAIGGTPLRHQMTPGNPYPWTVLRDRPAAEVEAEARRRLLAPQEHDFDHAFAAWALVRLATTATAAILREAFPGASPGAQLEVLNYALEAHDESFAPCVAAALDAPIEEGRPSHRQVAAALFAAAHPDARYKAGLERLRDALPGVKGDLGWFLDGFPYSDLVLRHVEPEAVKDAVAEALAELGPQPEPTDEERHLLAEARRLLLDPPRKPVRLKGVPAAAALDELRRRFDVDSELFPRTDASSVTVTVDLADATLMEALASVLSQAGLHFVNPLDPDDLDFRDHAVAWRGWLLELDSAFALRDGVSLVGVARHVVGWFRSVAIARLDEVVFPDGSRLRSRLDFPFTREDYARRGGRLAEVRGSIVVTVPATVRRRRLAAGELEVGKRVEVDGHFFRLDRREKLADGTFAIRYSFGRHREDGDSVVVAGPDDRPLAGTQFSCGGSQEEGSFEELTAPSLPVFVWTFAPRVETRRVPVVWRNVVLPESTWRGR